MEYGKRITKLQSKLRRKKIDGMLVAKPANRRYLCGYCGDDHGINETSGLLLVPAKGNVYLLTDFRFKLQATREVPWAEVILYPKGLLNLLGGLLPNLDIKRLGFESHYTLHATAGKMAASLAKKKIELTPLVNLIETMREIKDSEEIDIIRQSVELNETVFSEVFANIDSYRTEIDLALAIEVLMRRRGAEGPSFSTIVASGKNSALPHAVPGTGCLGRDEALTIDMGLIFKGYCSDMTRNFVPGAPSKRYLKLHRLVRKAQVAGMNAIRAGVRCCDVDKVARSVIIDAGYGDFFGHSLGHGVGLEVHEEPRLSSRSRKKLKAGTIVTVEPGIYIPDWGGIRLENMVVVREGGYENLNNNTTWLDI